MRSTTTVQPSFVTPTQTHSGAGGLDVTPPATVTENQNTLFAGLLPRGIRNNNPGNIRHNPANRWQGQAEVQTDAEFVQFISPQYGFRAMTRILRNYQRQGVTSLYDMIHRWAPSNENHTANYVEFVSQYSGIAPHNDVDLSAYLPRLLKAIAIFENGQDYATYYSDAMIQDGIALA